ncbi:MAG: hypothetical protein ACP5KW_11345 [Thermoproteota archaeon]|jgi:hypothetical protein
MRRKVWSTGNKIIHTLPREWGEKILNNYKGEIEEVVLANKIILTPPPREKNEIEINSEVTNILELKMKIVSAYMDGYDLIRVPASEDFLRKLNLNREEYLRKIQSFIPNVICRLSNDSSAYILNVHEEIYPIDKIFEEIKEILEELKKRVVSSIESFPNSPTVIEEKIGKNETYIKEQERKIDYITFLTRRVLNKALESAEVCERLEIKNDKDIIPFYTILTYYERISDLHLEIVYRLRKMLGRAKSDASNLNLEAFRSLYEKAYNTVETSLKAVKDAREGLGLILEKENLQNKFSKDKKDIKDLIEKQNNKLLIRDLVILEGKILAIPYLSVNICELAFNKDKAAWSK